MAGKNVSYRQKHTRIWYVLIFNSIVLGEMDPYQVRRKQLQIGGANINFFGGGGGTHKFSFYFFFFFFFWGGGGIFVQIIGGGHSPPCPPPPNPTALPVFNFCTDAIWRAASILNLIRYTCDSLSKIYLLTIHINPSAV